MGVKDCHVLYTLYSVVITIKKSVLLSVNAKNVRKFAALQ